MPRPYVYSAYTYVLKSYTNQTASTSVSLPQLVQVLIQLVESSVKQYSKEIMAILNYLINIMQIKQVYSTCTYTSIETLA